MDTPAVGALVVPAPPYRESLGLGEGAAILMALRRGSGQLYYAQGDRSYWIPIRSVRAIPAEAVPVGCREHLLHELLVFLAAEEATLESRGGTGPTLCIETAGISRERLTDLATRLGPRLVDYRIVPGSMRAVVVELDLTALPDAAGAGT